MPQNPTESIFSKDRFDAVLFDLDGVITSTAALHAACWKTMFDEFLKRRAEAQGEEFQPFDIETDYRLHVDGKPRSDGVRDFLRARGIDLPEGNPDDPADQETISGLGNRKNELVQEAIAKGQVEVYESSVRLVRQLIEQGFRIAVVTSSRNCIAVLEAVKIADLFEARVDGEVAIRYGLPGKPAPDSFLKAAELLGVESRRAVVVEDAISGVQAGRAGGFGLVLGVDRLDHAEDLRREGADLVVKDLGELLD